MASSLFDEICVSDDCKIGNHSSMGFYAQNSSRSCRTIVFHVQPLILIVLGEHTRTSLSILVRIPLFWLCFYGARARRQSFLWTSIRPPPFCMFEFLFIGGTAYQVNICPLSCTSKDGGDLVCDSGVLRSLHCLLKAFCNAF